MFGECHGHIFMDGISFKQAYALHAQGVDRADVRRKLAEYADAGVTFFRDGGDCLGVSAYAKQIAPEYEIDYRTPIFAIHRKGHYGKIVGRGFEDLREYRALVAEAKAAGADFIKVMFSGIMDFAGDGSVTGEPLPREEIREMIRIAHEEGFAVMAHVNGSRAVQDAAECGVDSVEHGNFLEEEALLAMKEQGTVWVPTLVTIHNLLQSGRYEEALIHTLEERQQERIRRAFALGVQVALGSDAGAYRVMHVFGIEDEYRAFAALFPDQGKLDAALRRGEAAVREKFRRK